MCNFSPLKIGQTNEICTNSLSQNPGEKFSQKILTKNKKR